MGVFGRPKIFQKNPELEQGTPSLSLSSPSYSLPPEQIHPSVCNIDHFFIQMAVFSLMTHLPLEAHHFWANYVALNIISLFYFLCLLWATPCGMPSFPDPGLNMQPLPYQCRVLTTGPPGKFPYFCMLCCNLIIYNALISYIFFFGR